MIRSHNAWIQVELRLHQYRCYLFFLISGTVDNHLLLLSINSSSFLFCMWAPTQFAWVSKHLLMVDLPYSPSPCPSSGGHSAFRKHWFFCAFPIFQPHSIISLLLLCYWFHSQIQVLVLLLRCWQSCHSFCAFWSKACGYKIIFSSWTLSDEHFKFLLKQSV